MVPKDKQETPDKTRGSTPPGSTSALDRKTRQQQRLEALGALASGVAHEINNPVQSIMNYAQLISGRSTSPQFSEYATEILHEAERVATIVRNLLSFARQEGEPYMEASMAEMVQHTLSLTAAVLRKEYIEVSVDIGDDLPAVRCHPQQVQQVVMNLVTYCRDALNARYPGADPNKRLHIMAQVHEAGGNPTLRLTMQGQSLGLEPEALERLFDPFDSGSGHQGSGLGLALCHAIASDHGGQISAESEVGSYIRFHLDLPLTAEA